MRTGNVCMLLVAVCAAAVLPSVAGAAIVDPNDPNTWPPIDATFDRISDTEALISITGTYMPPRPSLRSARMSFIEPWAFVGDPNDPNDPNGLIRYSPTSIAIGATNTVLTSEGATVTSAAPSILTVPGVGASYVMLLYFSLNPSVAGITIDGQISLILTDGVWGPGGTTDDVWYGYNNSAVVTTNTGTYTIIDGPPPLPGDANLDGIVDSQDFTILKANFGQPGGWENGDFNDDGIVDSQDFTILKANFGQTGVVPEPASAMLLLAGLPWLLRKRRNRCGC